ncbi:MAG: response regulator [Planctomycetales bacterium]|nr:response regulator [Planctomycetales bacterium]
MSDLDLATELRINRLVATRYSLGRPIFESTGASSYYAIDVHTQKPVVVSVASPRLLDRGTLARLKFSVGIRAAINVPTLERILTFGDDEECGFFTVSQFVPGQSVQELVKEAGPQQVLNALAIAKCLFEALDQLHSQNLVHGGVSTSTIIIASNSLPGELPSAVLVGADRSRNIAHFTDELNQSDIDSLRFISPEEAGLIDADFGPCADLYSAGVVLFYLLTGQFPFDGNSTSAILHEHLTAPVPDLRSIIADAPRELNELIQRLLRKSPTSRYQTSRAVVDDISAIISMLEQGHGNTCLVIGGTDKRATLTEPAFVTREDELTVVSKFLSDCIQGNGEVLVIRGQSGSGKSRLLLELTRQARSKKIHVLRGAAKNQSAQKSFVQFNEIADCLMALVQRDPQLAEQLKSQLETQASDLIQAIPRLRSLFSESLTENSSPEAFGENRTLDALMRFLDAISDPSSPFIVIFDDCQWSDHLSLQALRKWQQNMVSCRHSSIVVSYRDEEVAENHILRQIESRGRSLHLRAFTSTEIRKLLESMAGKLPDQVVNEVNRLVAGSPFMATAILRGLVESSALSVSNGQWQVDQEKLRVLQSSTEAAQILMDRLNRLPEPTLRILTVGAVIGREFSVDLAAWLADASPSKAFSALAEAQQRNLVWARAEQDIYAFVHDKIRESLLASISNNERQRFHLLASAYFREHYPERVTDIAYHYSQAGQLKLAMPYALTAAKHARNQFSLEVAENQYKIAYQGSTSAVSTQRRDISEGLGETLMLRGKYDEAEIYLREAAEFSCDQLSRAAIELRIAELAFKRGDKESATVGFEQALQILGIRVPQNIVFRTIHLVREISIQLLHTFLPRFFVHRRKRQPTPKKKLAIQLYSKLAHAYWFCRTRPQCLWAHLRNMNLAESYPPSDLLGVAYAEHAPAVCLVPCFERAIHYVEKSLAIRRELKDTWGEGQSLAYHSFSLFYASRYAQCIEKGTEAVKLFERTGDYWQMHIARYQVAASLYHLGRFEESIRECQINYNSGIEIGDEQASGIILDVWARATRGNLPPKILDLELQRRRQDPQGVAQVLLAKGICHLYKREFKEAVGALEKASQTFSKAGIINAYTMPVWAWLATAYRRYANTFSQFAIDRRDYYLARSLATSKKYVRYSRLNKNDLARAYRELGIVYAHQGKFRKADRYLAMSLQVATDQHSKFEYAKTQWYLSQIHQARETTNWQQEQAAAVKLHEEMGSRSTASEPTLPSLSLVDRFDGVLAWGRQIALSLTPEKIFEEATAAAERLLRGEECFLVRLDSADASLCMEDPFCKRLVSLSLENGRATVCFEEDQPRRQLEATRCGLSVPIRVREKTLAVLCVTHSQIKNLFGPDEMRLADFVAAIASAALENANGFLELSNLNETLEHRVAEGTATAIARANELAKSNRELKLTAQELRNAQSELQQAKDTAEAANAMKSRFLARMSHEIRTPMNGILGMTDLAMRSGLNSRQQGYLQIVKQSGEALLSLLNDILDLSKVEAGKMSLETIPVLIQRQLSDISKLMYIYAVKKEIELICWLDSSLPYLMYGDPCRIRQILTNLIGNAIKFTDYGEVMLRAYSDTETLDTPCLHVEVRDTGLGIAQDKQSLIFQAFEQSDTSTTRRFGGTGLGLAICAELVALMKGKIWVESELGHGSTFHVVIPFIDSQPELINERALAGKSVIIIGQNDSLCRAYRNAAEAVGGLCESFQSIPMALEHLDNHQDKENCIVLLDIAQNTAWNTRLLDRSAQRIFRDLNCFLLYSGEPVTEIARFFNIAPEWCLMKPIAAGELIAVLSSVTGPKQANLPVLMSDINPDAISFDYQLSHAVASSDSKVVEVESKFFEVETAPESGRTNEQSSVLNRDILSNKLPSEQDSPSLVAIPINLQNNCQVEETSFNPTSTCAEPNMCTELRVLLADDAIVNQEVAKGILEILGCTCDIANNGQEAVIAAAKTEYDLILMDLEMPHMDGLEATRQIREYEAQGKHTPIIAMTAHAINGTEEKCMRAGMNAWLTKPIDPQIMIEKIQELVQVPL